MTRTSPPPRAQGAAELGSHNVRHAVVTQRGASQGSLCHLPDPQVYRDCGAMGPRTEWHRPVRREGLSWRSRTADLGTRTHSARFRRRGRLLPRIVRKRKSQLPFQLFASLRACRPGSRQEGGLGRRGRLPVVSGGRNHEGGAAIGRGRRARRAPHRNASHALQRCRSAYSRSTGFPEATQNMPVGFIRRSGCERAPAETIAARLLWDDVGQDFPCGYGDEISVSQSLPGLLAQRNACG